MTLDELPRGAAARGFGIALASLPPLTSVSLPQAVSGVGPPLARRRLDPGDRGLVPTRSGNGALDALQESGHFEAPDGLEAALAYGVGSGGSRLRGPWDVERLQVCAACFPGRVERLRQISRVRLFRRRCLRRCEEDLTDFDPSSRVRIRRLLTALIARRLVLRRTRGKGASAFRDRSILAPSPICF
jgi:hypothetical protein